MLDNVILTQVGTAKLSHCQAFQHVVKNCCSFKHLSMYYKTVTLQACSKKLLQCQAFEHVLQNCHTVEHVVKNCSNVDPILIRLEYWTE